MSVSVLLAPDPPKILMLTAHHTDENLEGRLPAHGVAARAAVRRDPHGGSTRKDAVTAGQPRMVTLRSHAQ
ncbi:hypothetical protein AB0J63_00535 [Streptosporangium canum]|uniref:hypothetical protein n=1 Tax=Streptosporangium canum TaxID=324952 RepID=UPI003427D7A4